MELNHLLEKLSLNMYEEKLGGIRLDNLFTNIASRGAQLFSASF